MTPRLLLLAALFPFAGLGQLELALMPDDTLIDLTRPLDMGSAASCQTLVARLRIHNPSAATVEIDTLEVAPTGVFKKDSRDPLPGSSFVVGAGSFRDFWIDFAPHTPGTYTATLTVNSLHLTLTGRGVTAPTLTGSGGESYCPGDSIYVGRTQVATSVQTTLTIVNPTETAVVATVAGKDFGPTTPLTVAAGATQPLSLIFTPSIANQETGTLTINGLVYNLAGDGFAAPLLLPALQLSESATRSGTQAQVSIPLSAPAAATFAGQLTIAFQPAGNLADDPTVMFTTTSTRVISVLVNPGDTAVHFQAGDPSHCTFQTGTTAGVIAFTLTIGGTTITTSTTIPASPIALDLSTAVPSTDRIIVSLTGFDNTHAASQLTFTFYDAAGKAIAPGLIQSDVSGPFANYYSQHPEVGGVFYLQAEFPVTGDITQVASVDVQIANPVGVAAPPRLIVQ